MVPRGFISRNLTVFLLFFGMVFIAILTATITDSLSEFDNASIVKKQVRFSSDLFMTAIHGIVPIENLKTGSDKLSKLSFTGSKLCLRYAYVKMSGV